MNSVSFSKKPYASPELEFIFYNTEDILTGSNGTNIDHNDNGSGSGLFGDDNNPDVNYDYYDFSDMLN